MVPTPDGKGTLFEMIHRAEQWEKPRALVILHGYGEHGGRYLHFPHYLRDEVDALFIPDMRGHGRSDGKRGDAESFGQLVSDWGCAIRRFHLKLQGRFSNPEMHIFAHSLGGLVALHLLKEHQDLPVRSLALSAPLLGLFLRVSRLKQIIAKIAGKILKTLRMRSDLDRRLLSHDPAVLEALDKDALTHGKISARFFSGMVGAIRTMNVWRGPMVYPVAFFVPLDDRVVNSSATLAFAEALTAREKEIFTYEGSYHDAFMEGCGPFSKETAFADLAAWLKSH
jgi:alpha-beta hydrolase superfamily lysophospholipase